MIVVTVSSYSKRSFSSLGLASNAQLVCPMYVCCDAWGACEGLLISLGISLRSFACVGSRLLIPFVGATSTHE